MNMAIRISQIAKDFDLKNAQVISIVEEALEIKKTASQSLNVAETDVLFDVLIQNLSTNDSDAYFSMEKPEMPVEETVKPEIAEEKPETKEEKAETKPAQKQKKAPAKEETKTEKQPEKKAKKETAKPEKKQAEKKTEPQKQVDPKFAERFAQKAKEKQEQQRKQKGKTAPQPKHERETVTVSTRDEGNIELDKHNTRYEDIAPASKMMKDNQSSKQKIKQRPQQRRIGTRSQRRETEEERLKRIAAERKKQTIKVVIGEEISITDLAVQLKVPAKEVVTKLFKLGVMANVNAVIDFDTAAIVSEEFDAVVEKEVVVTIEDRIINLTEDKDEDLVKRSPVVVIMGHVDHGKTSLLDALRHSSVTSTESGGITQHIGAYRVNLEGQDITFLDTPGHAAFTAMRARGAMATDIAILVVAADDGIMPQTIEAINHAKAAGVSIIVAINKMDKPEANPDRIMQQLTEYELVPEEWGGDTICVPVSAKTGMNLDTLLESVLLVAEMLELKANPDREARGVVIEARLDKGKGPIATLLVQNGTLRTGDTIVAGTAVGRVRTMVNDKGKRVKEAGPSVPVEITGLAETPKAGDNFDVVSDERLARELVEQRKEEEKEAEFNSLNRVTLDTLFSTLEQGQVKDLNLIVKADVQGSVEALKQNLEKLSNDEVRVRVIHGGVGPINESDVMLAGTSDAIIIGFHVRPEPAAQANAERDNIELRMYMVIYDCIEDIEAAIKGMLAPKFHEVELGRVEVRQVFKLSSAGIIAGSHVQSGKVERNARVRVVRDGIVYADEEIASLKRNKDDVKEVAAGYECGIGLLKYGDIKEGDIFEVYRVEEVKEG
jgi:translation initiation factor IF-2